MEQDEARIYVESEDEPKRTLLETKIQKDDGYQKQQGRQNTCQTARGLTGTYAPGCHFGVRQTKRCSLSFHG
jgi:hypothetical protein